MAREVIRAERGFLVLPIPDWPAGKFSTAEPIEKKHRTLTLLSMNAASYYDRQYWESIAAILKPGLQTAAVPQGSDAYIRICDGAQGNWNVETNCIGGHLLADRGGGSRRHELYVAQSPDRFCVRAD